MGENQNRKISTESYKGVRDFYPEDMFAQKYIWNVWRMSAEEYGYAEYGASILEPAELYRAKSGEEIVNEQTYTFTDRGDREVTLRPEMTPTVARMVAQKRQELSFPLRWYSIPNLFRYERPQKGRLREHWQLNVDIFGVPGIEADVETVSLAAHIMRSFGAKEEDYEIRISSRDIMSELFSRFGLDEGGAHAMSKLIDKRAKVSSEEFERGVREILPNRSGEFISLIDSPLELFEMLQDNDGLRAVHEILERLQATGITNASFDPNLMRGFDYYTGVIFEIFDTSPENRRSMFGGGRYDRLLEIFGTEKVPAVGFGMGDVTLRDFLESRNLLPAYRSPAEIYVCTAGSGLEEDASRIADHLRGHLIPTAVDLSGRKLGDQLKKAERDAVPFALIVGENELASGNFKLKELATRKEGEFTIDDIIEYIKTTDGGQK